MYWQQGTGLPSWRTFMNTLPLIRSHTQRAERLHKAQLIATAKGSKYHDNAILNADSASRKAKAKLLQNAQLMAF
jgi:hypothetical protein|tara:strand:- start:415 stop:639 length:225 start_codon:yes stop_codon:yes gene_type:complete